MLCDLPMTSSHLFPELFTDRPTVAASAVVPGPRRGEGGEPAVLRAAPVRPGAPARTPDLEPHAPAPGSAGGLTFHDAA